MTTQYHFELPLYGVAKPTKSSKNPTLSVNWYRNAHYRDSNNAKVKFKQIVKPQIDKFDPITTQIKIHYTYYAARNNSPDLDNFVGTVKKFFQDAIVECGLIEDDNVNFIVSNSESYGGVDKENPRVDAVITEINN